MDPDVPLVVPEINGAAARRHKGILSCPNCTTIVTVMPLKPLHDAGKLKRVVATSFQAVSGAGVGGIDELRAQTMAWSKGETVKANSFSIRSRSTCFPPAISARAATPARKPNSSRRPGRFSTCPICRSRPTTVRVPVFTAHSIAVNAETETQALRRAGARGLREFSRAFACYDDPAQTITRCRSWSRARTIASSAASARISAPQRHQFLGRRRSAAQGRRLNGVQIAELLIGAR